MVWEPPSSRPPRPSDGSDGDQAGSYFGTQEANRPLHALYALDNGTVTLDNLSGTSQSGLSVESKVYNLAGTVLDDQTASNLTLASQQVLNKVLTPRVPTSPVETYFVELLLKQNGSLVDRNVYWLSSATATSTQQSGPDLATQGATPVISVSGWNVPKVDIAAPVP